MTVGELLSELAKNRPELPVYVATAGHDFEITESVENGRLTPPHVVIYTKPVEK